MNRKTVYEVLRNDKDVREQERIHLAPTLELAEAYCGTEHRALFDIRPVTLNVVFILCEEVQMSEGTFHEPRRAFTDYAKALCAKSFRYPEIEVWELE